MIQNQEKKNIGVLTPPIGVHSLIPLSNLLDILLVQSHSLYLITGNEGYNSFKNDVRIHTYGINHCGAKNNFLRIVKFIYMQIQISIALAKIVRKCDVWIFFLGSENMFLPMCIAKLFRKKVFLMFAGSSVHTLYYDDLVSWLKLLTNINCTLSTKMILYSKNLIKEWNLEKYQNKISIAPRHFLDFDKFKIQKQLSERDELIGYIGRLSQEKGTLNFINAIPKIVEKQKDIKFFVGGDGQLRGEIEIYLEDTGLNNKIKLIGWIPHNELPNYLNELKLLVLPSYTEGLPNIMLEAMACGTPVLATPVGAIPDIIKDGETGFIMKNNSPECIAENVMRALEHPDLETIVGNARALVEREFTYEVAVECWKEILQSDI